MSEFWTYEDKRTYDKRVAKLFESEAQKYIWGDMTQTPQKSGLNPELGPADLNAIQPKSGQKQHGGSFLGKALGTVDDVTSKLFLGDVRQPWDVLRPVSRLFEAETKYIAHPLARKAFESVGVNYDELPGIAKLGIEAVASPSSWVGIGLLGKGAKALKLAPELARFAAAESLPEYFAKNLIPNVVGAMGSGAAQDVGLPPWVGLPLALASSKGVDFYYGAPGQVKNLPKGTSMSIVIPDSGMEAFHGTTAEVRNYGGAGKKGSGLPLGSDLEAGPSISFRHAPASEGGFTGIFFTSNPRSYETENWGARTRNLVPTVEDLQGMKPFSVLGSTSDRNVNIVRLAPRDADLAQAEKLREIGIPQTPTQSTAKYSVSEVDTRGRALNQRTTKYFHNEQDVLDYIQSEVPMSQFDTAYDAPKSTRWGKPQSSAGARIYPALVKPGTKLFDPHVDPHPPSLAEAIKNDSDLARNLEIDKSNSQMTVPVFYGDVFNRQQRAQFQKELTEEGYSGFKTRHELLIWDENALVPLFEARGAEWSVGDAMRKATQRNPGLAMSVPALAAAFPAAGSARAIGLGIMGDSDPMVQREFSPQRADFEMEDLVQADKLRMQESAEALNTVYKNEVGMSGVSGAGETLDIPRSVDELNAGIKKFKERLAHGVTLSTEPQLRRGLEASLSDIDNIEEYLKDPNLSPQQQVVNRRMLQTYQETAEEYRQELAKRLKGESKGPNWSRGPRMGITGDNFETDWLKQWQDSLDLARDPEKFKAAQEAKRAQVAKEYEQRLKQEREGGKLTGRANKLSRMMDQQRGPGTMKAQPEDFANRVTQIFDSGVQDIFGWRSTEDAITHGYQNRSFTQWLRGKVADMLPQSLVDAVENKGLRLRDDELSYLIRSRAQMLHQGDTYAATLADLQQGIINKQGVTTKGVRIKGQMETVISDPVVVASAKALETQRPGLKLLDAGGRLYLDDFLEHYKALGLSPDQEAWAASIHAMTDSLTGLEQAMKLKLGDFNGPDGMLVHRQPLTRPVTVQDPRSLQDYQVQIDQGPVLRSRYGSTQVAAKPRDVRTKAEGLDAGISYLPFIEAQRARYAQGWRTIADDWLKTATSDIGRKPSQLIDPSISAALTDAIDLRRQYQWLESELKASIARPMKNSFRAPRFTIRPELKDMFEQAAWTGAISKQDQRLAGWRAVRERLTSERGPWDANYEDLSKARKEALKTVQSYGTEEFPVDFGGQRYPLREGRQLAALTQNSGEGLAERTLGVFNKNVRPLMATLDASFMGIQGLMALFVDPASWYGALKHGVMGDFDAYLQKAYSSGLLDTAREAGVYYAARNDFGEFLFPKSVLNVPGIGKAADVSNTWFTNFGNVLRLEMFNAGVKGGMDTAQLEKLGRTVNLATGFNPGKPTSAETIGMFAPRFFRAQLGLLTDAVTKTISKKDMGQGYGVDLSRASAARNLGQMVALGSALTIGVNEALGQPTDFDPESSNFMRIRGLGRDISVFGPWDSLVRAMSTLATKGPDDALAYLARSKASPAFGRIIDIIDGETFTGDKLRFGTPGEIAQSAATMAAQSGPISASTLLSEGLPQNPAEVAGAGLGFLGIKASPISGYEQLVNTQEDLARQHYNTTWDKLEPYQKDDLRKKYDLQLESSSDVQKAFDLRANIDKRFNARQLELDDALPVGKDWIDARDTLRREQVGAYGQWAEDHPEAAARIRAGKPSNPNEAARQGYYSIFDKANQEDWTPQEVSEAISQFEEGLSTDQKAYLDRNLGLKDTPRVKEYKLAQKTLRPYWQFADEVWDRMKLRNPTAAQFGSIQEYQNSLIEDYQSQGLSDARVLERLRMNPLMHSVQRATDVVRQRYRRQHRDVDKLLTKWYGYTPVQ